MKFKQGSIGVRPQVELRGGVGVVKGGGLFYIFVLGKPPSTDVKETISMSWKSFKFKNSLFV